MQIMLKYISLLLFCLRSAITSLGAVFLGTFLYPFIWSEVLDCLHFKGCVAMFLPSAEIWDTPLFVVNMQKRCTVIGIDLKYLSVFVGKRGPPSHRPACRPAAFQHIHLGQQRAGPRGCSSRSVLIENTRAPHIPWVRIKNWWRLSFQLTTTRLWHFFGSQTSLRFCRRGSLNWPETIHSGTIQNSTLKAAVRCNATVNHISVITGRKCKWSAQKEGQDWPGCQAMLTWWCCWGETFLFVLPSI